MSSDNYSSETPSDDFQSSETPSDDFQSSETPCDDFQSSETPCDDFQSSETPCDDFQSSETPCDDFQASETQRLSESSSDESPPHYFVNYRINSVDDITSSDDSAPENKSDTSGDVEREHEEMTKNKYIKKIQLGPFEIDTWYFSPYPDEYREEEKLFICEFCLKYMRLERSYCYHLGKCQKRSPPGKEIYSKGTLTVREIDPAEDQLYCQLLCLLAKCFIDHKTVHYDVDPFLFYVLCEVDDEGTHLRGYFSKEKESPDGHNVACILTLPPFQKQGYGKLLIGFSYELSKFEGVPGTPEKPLSELGMISYRSYWAWLLLDVLKDFRGTTTINNLSRRTGLANTDILNTLQSLNMMKYWKGDNSIFVTPDIINAYIWSEQIYRPRLTVDPSCIRWIPHSKRPKKPIGAHKHE